MAKPHRALIPLVLMTFFTFLLLICRKPLFGGVQYLFLAWNLFLAWIPLVLSLIINSIESKPAQNKPKTVDSTTPHSEGVATAVSLERKPVQSSFLLSNIFLAFLGFFWLIFYPNAPYILTDFAHFSWVGFFKTQAFDARPWYDFLIFINSGICGFLIAYLSLNIMHGIVIKRTGRVAGRFFVVIVLFLSSWAIYLGRFIRLNSWDVWNNPLELLNYVMLGKYELIFVCAVAIFLILAYTAMTGLNAPFTASGQKEEDD